MTTVASQGLRYKSAFCAPTLTMNTSKRNSVLKLAVEVLQSESTSKDTRKMRLVFAFFKSVCLSPEVVKEIMKMRLIDELQAKLAPSCKNEKDIRLQKNWLVQYSGLLAAFASTADGRASILKIKPCFEFSLFVIDTITPAGESVEVTALAQMVINIFLFLRNCASSRTGKLQFLSDAAFLPCMMAFLSARN